jgi:hypothetical protein
MQPIPSAGTDLSDREIEHVIWQAKILRAQTLNHGPRRALEWIGCSAFVCLSAFVLVVGASSARHQTLDNTVVIERLAKQLAHAETIEAGTAREISQLLRRPDYDCRQLTCDAWIERRNAAARARVDEILARYSFPAVAASK